MFQDQAQGAAGEGRGPSRTVMVHPRCTGCGFSFTGSPKVLMCEGGDHPGGGRCEWCLAPSLGSASSPD